MEQSQSGKKTLFSYENVEEEQMAKTVAEIMYRYDRIAGERIGTLGDIRPEHVKRFWEQGFLVIEKALDDNELEDATHAIMDILFGKSLGSKIQFVRPVQDLKSAEEKELAARKVYSYIDHEPRLRAIAYLQKIMQVMEMLLGEQAKVVQDQAILKPPSGGAEKPWHQDMAYGNLAYDKPVVGAWIALDPAELDNGCMHVIPYSHMEGGTPHYALRDWQICDRSIKVAEDLAVPLESGGMLLFSGLLHHGTPPNFTAKRRRALQIHYAPVSAEKLQPAEYKRMFTNVMTGAEC